MLTQIKNTSGVGLLESSHINTTSSNFILSLKMAKLQHTTLVILLLLLSILLLI